MAESTGGVQQDTEVKNIEKHSSSLAAGIRNINFCVTSPDMGIRSSYSNLGVTPGLAGCTCMGALQRRRKRFYPL